MKGYTTIEKIENYLLITIEEYFKPQVEEWIGQIEKMIDRETERESFIPETGRQAVFDPNTGDSYITVPVTPSLDFTGDFSVEFDVTFDTLDNYPYLVMKGNQDGSKDEWNIYYDTGGSRISLGVQNDSEGNEVYFDWVPTLSVKYHLKFVYDASEGKCTLYVNEEIFGSQTGLPTSMDGGTNLIAIGDYIQVGNDPFQGKLDELEIRNASGDLVLKYTFDNDTAKDDSLYGNDGSLNNVTFEEGGGYKATERLFDGDGTDTLIIPDCIEVLSVKIDDEELDPAIPDYYLYPANATPKTKIVLNGAKFTKGKQNITVKAAWAYSAEVPEDIGFAATVITAGIINNSGNQQAVRTLSIGRYSVTYDDTKGWDDFKKANDILASYRRFTIA